MARPIAAQERRDQRASLGQLVQIERDVPDVVLERVRARPRPAVDDLAAQQVASSRGLLERDRAQSFSGLEAGATAVLMEAVAEHARWRTRWHGDPAALPAASARRASGRCTAGGSSRARRGPALGRRLAPGLTDTRYSTGPGSDCRRFMWYVIVSWSAGRWQSPVSMFHDTPGPPPARQQRGVGVQHDAIGRVLEAVECLPFGRVGVAQQPARHVAVRGHDHARRSDLRGRVAVRTVAPLASRVTLTTGSPARTAPAGSASTMRLT